MATNPSTLPENSGRITAPDANYLYGSAKDDSTGTTGDGTPIKKALMNDTYGFQQALLRAASLVPTGDADTAVASQYLQSVVQQVMGRAFNFDESGAADAYVLDLRTNQQGPGALFDGMFVKFAPTATNTGAPTVDVSALLGQAPGTTVVDMKLEGGTVDPAAGDIVAANETTLLYRTSPSAHFELVNPQVSGDFARSFANPGYQSLPGGLLIQFGQTATASGNGSFTDTFALTFPNAVLAAFSNIRFDNGAAIVAAASTTTIDGSAIDASSGVNAPNGQVVDWLAIGY